MEKLHGYAERLYQYNEVFIPEHEWTAEFEQAFREQLKIKNIHDISIYREYQQPHRRLICLAFHYPSAEVEQIYPKRSFIAVILPILISVLAYFLILSLAARDEGKMVSAGFLMALPFSIGALIEYAALIYKPRNKRSILFRQLWLSAGLLVLGAIVLREGIICLLMAAPLFLICTMLGALVMHLLCRKLWRPEKRLYSIGLLPLLALWFMPDMTQYHQGSTQQEIVINAPIEQVYASINHIQNIRPQEIKYSPIFTMGFPMPISGITALTENGLVRTSIWQRGIHFKEKIIQAEPPKQLIWTYIFDQHSFPQGSLDDHLDMGGKYFNLLTTDYQLQALGPKQTRLALQVDYRLSTEVNWYADLWVQYVLNEFSE